MALHCGTMGRVNRVERDSVHAWPSARSGTGTHGTSTIASARRSLSFAGTLAPSQFACAEQHGFRHLAHDKLLLLDPAKPAVQDGGASIRKNQHQPASCEHEFPANAIEH